MKDQLIERFPSATPVIMDDNGNFTRQGDAVNTKDINPVAAFACSDLYTRGPSAVYMTVLLKSKTVRWVQSGAAGFDHPIFKALVENGIRLTSNNASAKAIAEFVMASVLNYFQPFAERIESQKQRSWNRIEFQELSSKQWLIIGLGNIGREIAQRAMAFDCRVTGLRRNPTGGEETDFVITPDRLRDALPDADVVVLAVSLNEESKQLVDRCFLKQMKPSAILVNIARGSLIDESALLESLDQGKPAYAILDVFETEPLPEESPFWGHPRVQVTAHCSAHTPEKRARGDQVFLKNLQRYMTGNDLLLEIQKTDFGE